MTTGDRGATGLGLPERTRQPLAGALAAVALIGAVVPWLGLVNAWRLSGDRELFPEPEQQSHRALVISEVLAYWPGTAGSGLIGLAVAGAAAALLLTGRPVPADGRARRPAAVVLVVGGAAALGIVAGLVVGSLRLYSTAVTPEEFSGRFLAPRPLGLELAPLLTVTAEIIAWTVVLVLAVSVGRPSEAEADGDLAEEERTGGANPDGHDHDHGAPPRPQAPADGAHGAPVHLSAPSSQATADRVDPSRLRSDGSSESGYDEFRFRR
jgi:hypothetical protein